MKCIKPTCTNVGVGKVAANMLVCRSYPHCGESVKAHNQIIDIIKQYPFTYDPLNQLLAIAETNQ